MEHHFHADKGSKYDVETPYESRYPYLADRLGHPEILGTPFERLMRLESEVDIFLLDRFIIPTTLTSHSFRSPRLIHTLP